MKTMTMTGVGAAAMLLAAPALAQVAPPAQVLQRNPTVNPDRINEEQRRRAEDRANPDLNAPSRPDVEAPPPAAPTAATANEVRFTLTAVRFDPSSYLSASELQALVQPLIGREIALGELQGVVDRINQIYAERGLTTARAVLPAQEIEGGIVQIRLVEGRIGAITVEGGSPGSQAYVRRYGSPKAGSLATPSALENRLRLFNQNNDAQLRARLAPGGELGTTDVVLTAAEPARFGADIFLDNNGFSSTGEAEAGLVLRGYRLFSDADRATIVAVGSAGVRSGTASLSTPLGDRFRVGTSLSVGRTRVLYGPLAALDVRGNSLSFGGDIAALLLVGDRTTVTATGSVQTSLSRTDIAGQRVIENEALNASLGMVASYAVPGFAGTLQYQLTYARVEEKLSGNVVSPVLFQGSAVLAKSIVPKVQARLRGDWQMAIGENLPGILQYQIGGTRSSRAFSPGIAAGDRGLSAAAELAYGTVWDGLAIEPFAFVDHAQTSLPGLRSRAESVGAGISLTFAPHILVRASAATAIGQSGGIPGGSRGFISTTLRF